MNGTGKIKGWQIFFSAVVAVLLVGTIVGISLYRENARAEQAARLEEREKLAAPYRQEYEASQARLSRLKAELAQYEPMGKSMTMIIVQQCQANLYEQVYLKALKGQKISGIFTVTDRETVGAEGCITFSQYEELVKDGWSMAVTAPGNTEDPEGYFATVEANLQAEGISFPEIFVFGMGEYSRSLYEAVLNRGFRTVAYCQQDVGKGLCDLTETLCLSEEDVLMVPYYYTSKGTPYVQASYTKDMLQMNNRSLSIRCAIASGVKDLRDTTLVNLKNIGETVLSGRYYRSYKDYRAEKMAADAVTVNRVAELKEEIQREKQASEEWFRLWMDAYGDPSEE